MTAPAREVVDVPEVYHDRRVLGGVERSDLRGSRRARSGAGSWAPSGAAGMDDPRVPLFGAGWRSWGRGAGRLAPGARGRLFAGRWATATTPWGVVASSARVGRYRLGPGRGVGSGSSVRGALGQVGAVGARRSKP